MQQQVDVINTALGFLGNEPVIDLSAPSIASSAAAAKLMRSIETSRKTVLARQGWLCALELRHPGPVHPARLRQLALPGRVSRPRQRCLHGSGKCRRLADVPCLDDAAISAGQRAALGARHVRDPERRAHHHPGRPRLAGRLRFLTPPAISTIAYVERWPTGAALSDHVADAIAADCAARQAYSITGDKAQADVDR